MSENTAAEQAMMMPKNGEFFAGRKLQPTILKRVELFMRKFLVGNTRKATQPARKMSTSNLAQTRISNLVECLK